MWYPMWQPDRQEVKRCVCHALYHIVSNAHVNGARLVCTFGVPLENEMSAELPWYHWTFWHASMFKTTRLKLHTPTSSECHCKLTPDQLPLLRFWVHGPETASYKHLQLMWSVLEQPASIRSKPPKHVECWSEFWRLTSFSNANSESPGSQGAVTSIPRVRWTCPPSKQCRAAPQQHPWSKLPSGWGHYVGSKRAPSLSDCRTCLRK